MTTTAVPTRSPVFSALTGLAGLAVLLQGLWAGLFMRPGASETWVGLHATGGMVGVVLAAVATGYAFLKLRARRDLWAGSAVLTALLVVQVGLGEMISEGGRAGLLAVHVPLAMALMALVAWLSLRASGRP